MNHKSSIPQKQCTKCKQEFPATSEYFYQDKKKPDGLFAACKRCEADRARKYNAVNAERNNERRREWRRANPEKTREINRLYRKKNPEKVREYDRRAWLKNPHQRGDVEKARQRKRQYRLDHAEEIAIYRKQYNATHTNEGRIYANQRRARIKLAGGEHTPQEIENQYKAQKGLCWWCSEPMGDDYHIDHRIPLSRGGTNDIGNIVIACPKCNLSKHNKLPHEWNGRLL